MQAPVQVYLTRCAGGLIMVCSDTSTRSYVLNNTASLKIFSNTAGYTTITGSTGAN